MPSRGGPGWRSTTPATRWPSCSGPAPARWSSPRADRSRQPGRPGGWRRGRAAGAARELVCAAMEHHAVLHCRALARRPAPSCGGADRPGRVDRPRRPGRGLRPRRRPRVGDDGQQRDRYRPAPRGGGRVVRRRSPGAVLHTDAVQAVTWLDLRRTAPADLVTVSAHKFGGPRAWARWSSGTEPSCAPRYRWWPGAGAPQRHPQRGRRRGHGRRLAAPVAGRGRGGWPGWPPCGTGWPTACRPR